MKRTILGCVLAPAGVAWGSTFQMCDTATAPQVHVKAINLVPDPIVAGSPLTVSFEGQPLVDLAQDAVMEVGVYVLGIKLAHASFELCDLEGVKCPLLAGDEITGKLTYNIPKEAPGGVELTTKIQIKDPADSVEYSCVEVAIKIAEPKLSAVESSRLPAVTAGLVAQVNELTNTWEAHSSPRFEGYTLEDAKRIAGGTVMKGYATYLELPARRYSSETAVTRTLLDAPLPESFDAREAFPACAAVIGRVRDQSDCGACWAFAATEAFNDRRCISSVQGDLSSAAKPDLTVLSAEDTLACCSGFSCGLSMGCNGGQPSAAWSWFTKRGVVSGLDYRDMGSGASCKPYEFLPCAHHVDPKGTGYPECPSGGEYPTPACVNTCSDAKYKVDFDADKRHAKEAYSLRTARDIQLDLVQNGPVTAAFSVYSDFLTYKSGVYEHVSGEFLGGHAIKIVGYGTDKASGKDYWTVMNSWNESWGEKGTFRILRGKNECGIEGQVVAGDA